MDHRDNPIVSDQENKQEEIPSVSFFRMFRFATSFDVILMVIGSIGAIATGASMPAFAYIWGRMTDSFLDADVMVEKSRESMLTFIYVGIGAFVAGLLMFGCWMVVG